MNSTMHHPAGDARGMQEWLRSRYADTAQDVAINETAAGACLRPLLLAIGWRGQERHLLEALPHFDRIEDIYVLRGVLARLNYGTQPRRLKLSQVGTEMVPCLFESEDGGVSVLLEREADTLLVFDGASASAIRHKADATPGTAYLVDEIDLEEAQVQLKRQGWIGLVLRRFRPLITMLLIVTFVTNLLALAVPIYTMNVYDKVIGAHSHSTLFFFLAGMGIVLLADTALRVIRARAVAYFGARCESMIGAATFERLLNMPIAMTERAPIGAQISRIRQFEGIRDVFTGAMANTVLDMPFVLVFLGAIALVGSKIVWVAIVLILVYAVMAAVAIPLTRNHVVVTGETRSRWQTFLLETISKSDTLREHGAEHLWCDRARQLIGAASARRFKAQQLNFTIQTLSQGLVMIAGIATIWIGTLMVMEQDLTVGGLIAVLALIWRVLAPINSAFLLILRVGQVTQTFKQINGLMRVDLDRVPGRLPFFDRSFSGAVELSRVSFRYTPRSEPALMSASLAIPPGQFVALTGASGSGKSTILKMIAGLYTPQAGAVQIDGLDTRQLDSSELRYAISYLPQKVTFFHGTIDQNVRLVAPTAEEGEIERACRDARVSDYASALPEWRDTRLTTEFQKAMPDGLTQRLALARTWVKQRSIVLLDEPASHLDASGEEGLIEKIQALRGKATIIMVTHRPSHMRLADRVVYMERGQIVHDAAPDQVLPLIMNAA